MLLIDLSPANIEYSVSEYSEDYCSGVKISQLTNGFIGIYDFASYSIHVEETLSTKEITPVSLKEKWVILKLCID